MQQTLKLTEIPIPGPAKSGYQWVWIEGHYHTLPSGNRKWRNGWWQQRRKKKSELMKEVLTQEIKPLVDKFEFYDKNGRLITDTFPMEERLQADLKAVDVYPAIISYLLDTIDNEVVFSALYELPTPQAFVLFKIWKGK